MKISCVAVFAAPFLASLATHAQSPAAVAPLRGPGVPPGHLEGEHQRERLIGRRGFWNLHLLQLTVYVDVTGALSALYNLHVAAKSSI